LFLVGALQRADPEPRDLGGQKTATGREPHQFHWETYFAEEPAAPGSDASPKEQMAYKLRR
jgi:hypothetical protein